MELSMYSQTCFERPVKGQCKMAFKSRLLINTDQFDIEMEIWDHKLFAYKTGVCLIEVPGNTNCY